MNIPVPARGHWAKVDAGLSPPRSPLPAAADRQVFISNAVAQSSPFTDPKDRLWLDGRLASEADFSIGFDSHPRRWHALVAPLREKLMARAKEYERAMAQRRRDEASTVKNKQFNVAAHMFDLEGGLLVPRHKANCLRVSALTYERALAIANALLLAAEARGCSAFLDEKGGEFRIEMEDAQLGFAVRERQEYTLTESGYKRYVPTPKLVLVMLSAYRTASVEIFDRGDGPVETRLSEFFPKLYRAVVKAREKRREDQERKRAESLARAQREEIARLRANEEETKIKEANRREQLLQDAERWRQATDLRAFIAAASALGAWDLAWQSWAHQIADDLDPLSGSPRG